MGWVSGAEGIGVKHGLLAAIPPFDGLEADTIQNNTASTVNYPIG
jgi:hypothetical protein